MPIGNGVARAGKVSNRACFCLAKIMAVRNERLIFREPDLMVKRRHADTFAGGAAFRTSLFGFVGGTGTTAIGHGRCPWPYREIGVATVMSPLSLSPNPQTTQ